MKPIRSPAACQRWGLVVRIEYSKQVDALYIHLREVPLAESRDIEEGVTLDFDAKGHLVGLEILDASERMGLSNLVKVSIENLPLERVPPDRVPAIQALTEGSEL
jgi:uncharacterized protein YuzE